MRATLYDELGKPEFQIDECECPRCHSIVRFFQPQTQIDGFDELDKLKKMYEGIIEGILKEKSRLEFELQVKRIQRSEVLKLLQTGRR